MKNSLLLICFITVYSFSQERIELFFDFNKDIPNASSTKLLSSWMNENQNVEVIKIAGYCDSIDSKSYNKDLASRRINAVLEILKNNKVRINPKVVLENNGKDFVQSKNQSENRKVMVYFNKNKLTNSIKSSNKGDLIKLKSLHFFNNSDVIVPNSEPILKELLEIMTTNKKLKIEIQGHICCKLPKQEDVISEARAKAVYNYLLRNNIDKNRMTYKGYGISRPIHPIPEKNAQQEDDNRRVELLIVEN